ncbi:hypothetical protein [Streptomyces sp. NPDC018045]|uniref:hypothetical protein n=1 Tax=Streptomyces sp. NPDC018045 TaxID=3365037 RepID=UPI0037BBFCC8
MSVARWSAEEGGCQHQQSTRPLALRFGLADSPTGLLVWIVEKCRARSDCGGELSSRFSSDFPDTGIAPLVHPRHFDILPAYYEYAQQFTRRDERVEVPTALALVPAGLSQPPRSRAERTYNITRYTHMLRGGHLAAHEEPEPLAHGLTEFFGAHRWARQNL